MADVVAILSSAFVAVVLWKLFMALVVPKSGSIDVAGPKKEHWLKGNYHRIFQDGLKYNLDFIDKYGGAVKIHALLGQEQLYISDPLALHHIVVKEQHIYEETDMFIMTNKLIFGEGLISTLGEQHRKQRKMLNPVFSMANMRELLPIIQPIADKMASIFLKDLTGQETREINFLPWLSRGALEYVSQAVLGLTFNALDPNQTSEYAEALRHFTPAVLRLILIRPFIPFVLRHFSLYWRNKMVQWLPIPGLQELAGIVNIMDTYSRAILDLKKAALYGDPNAHGSQRLEVRGDLGERIRGKDIMSIMLKANQSSEEADKLNDIELRGQISTILFAGFETTSSAICRILWILAREPAVQARLRGEVRETKSQYATTGGNASSPWEDIGLPYDALMSMPYLDAVVRETFRVFPPSSLFSRTTRQPTILPLQIPVRSASGSPISQIALKENTTIIMSLLGANHNKAIWGEDASQWKPERWLASTPPGTTTDGVKYPGVYATMMTFLGGGRACIGFKFAEMETKQVLVTLLSKMHFSLPSAVNAAGDKKEIYWKMNGLQTPVVPAPFGDNETAQVPLCVRRVRDDDFA